MMNKIFFCEYCAKPYTDKKDKNKCMEFHILNKDKHFTKGIEILISKDILWHAGNIKTQKKLTSFC